MGCDFNASLGVYVRVKNGMKPGKKTVTLRCCTDEKCKRYRVKPHGEFCSACGGAIGLVDIVADVKIDVNDLEDWNEDEFYKHDQNFGETDDLILKYNYTGFGADDNVVVSMAEITNLQHSTLEHLNRNADAMFNVNALKQCFGAENVSIEFGMIAYWS